MLKKLMIRKLQKLAFLNNFLKTLLLLCIYSKITTAKFRVSLWLVNIDQHKDLLHNDSVSFCY